MAPPTLKLPESRLARETLVAELDMEGLKIPENLERSSLFCVCGQSLPLVRPFEGVVAETC